MGDGNNSFFFVIMRFRLFINYIFYLINVDGIRLYKFEDLKEEVFQFYKVLMGSFYIIFFVVNQDIMRRGKQFFFV